MSDIQAQNGFLKWGKHILAIASIRDIELRVERIILTKTDKTIVSGSYKSAADAEARFGALWKALLCAIPGPPPLVSEWGKQ